MENPFEVIGHDAKVVAVDVKNVVVKAVEFPAAGIKVIETCVKDYGALKPILKTIVSDGVTVGAAVASAVAEKGLNWTDDVAAAHSAATFFQYFMSTFVPQIKAIYSQIEVDEANPTQAAN